MLKNSQQKQGSGGKKRKIMESSRLAKLMIQRRTLALMLVFGVAAFLALFAQAYDLAIKHSASLQKGGYSGPERHHSGHVRLRGHRVPGPPGH